MRRPFWDLFAQSGPCMVRARHDIVLNGLVLPRGCMVSLTRPLAGADLAAMMGCDLEVHEVGGTVSILAYYGGTPSGGSRVSGPPDG